MKKIVLFLLTVMMLSAFGAPAGKKSAPKWGKDYESAVKQATAQKKPIMILFTAPGWCGPCRNLEQNALTKPEFKKLMGKTVPVMLDFSNRSEVTPEMQNLSAKFQVRGYPTVIIANAAGKKIGHKVGYGGSADQYIRELSRYIGK